MNWALMLVPSIPSDVLEEQLKFLMDPVDDLNQESIKLYKAGDFTLEYI